MRVVASLPEGALSPINGLLQSPVECSKLKKSKG